MFREKATFTSLLLWPILYVGLSPEIVSIYAILIFIDIFTGITASYLDDKKKIKSQAMIRWIATKMGLFMLPFIIALVVKWLWGDGVELLSPMVAVTLSVLIASEAYSIIGNIYNIKTWKKVPEFDAIEAVMTTTLKTLRIVTENATKIEQNKEKIDEIEKKIH